MKKMRHVPICLLFVDFSVIWRLRYIKYILSNYTIKRISLASFNKVTIHWNSHCKTRQNENIAISIFLGHIQNIDTIISTFFLSNVATWPRYLRRFVWTLFVLHKFVTTNIHNSTSHTRKRKKVINNLDISSKQNKSEYYFVKLI